ncbi:MAG: serine hydrolase domain-containing protein [Acidimicrobiales bacterium]
MPVLSPTADPADLGFDGARLTRIDDHFRKYVDDGRLPGWSLVVARDGEIAHASTYGFADIESKKPLTDDAIFRIASMTKPICAVAAMILWEEGLFELKDHVYRYIPSFRDQKVFRSGSTNAPRYDAVNEPMEMWHLFTHTAGLTYGFMYSHSVDQMYRNAGFEWGTPRDLDLAGICDLLASLPLLFQPGAEWNYSMSIDVLGRVVEVLSGMKLGEFMQKRIFGPLGMTDTAFSCPAEKTDRLATAYTMNPADRKAMPMPRAPISDDPKAHMGGGGLVSTMSDYLKFAMMLRNGGELDGVRILSPRTVEYMAGNHLPGGADLSEYGRPLFAETAFDGVGFGLSMSVTLDPVKAKVPGSVGDYGWGGAFSTIFTVDPVEDLVYMLMTQLLPSSAHPIRPQFKQLVFQALVD